MEASTTTATSAETITGLVSDAWRERERERGKADGDGDDECDYLPSPRPRGLDRSVGVCTVSSSSQIDTVPETSGTVPSSIRGRGF